VSQTRLASVRGDLREFFLLEAAERRTAQLSPSQRESIQAYSAAAKRRLHAASALTDPGDAPTAVLLFREAWWCLTRAILLAEDEHADLAGLSPLALWEKLERVFAGRVFAGRALAAPHEIEDVRDLLLAPDPVRVDRLSPEDAGAVLEQLDTAVRWLVQLVEARSPAQLKWARTFRQVAAIAVLCAVVLDVIVRLLAPKNLALDKPTQSTPPLFETSAAAAVDGEKNGRFGFHSQESDSAFLTIDLQKIYDISKVKVFGRGECCFDQSIPLAFEISEDGATYRKVDERTTIFSEADPWVVTPASARARYLRLRVEHRAALVLSEVEAYGKLAK
jgi:hypothetical protein